MAGWLTLRCFPKSGMINVYGKVVDSKVVKVVEVAEDVFRYFVSASVS